MNTYLGGFLRQEQQVHRQSRPIFIEKVNGSTLTYNTPQNLDR